MRILVGFKPEVWVVSNMVEPSTTDSLGRNRLPSKRYSQSGGRLRPRHIVWTCKVCSRCWNVTSKAYRYDSKCRQCNTRNSILFTGSKGSWNPTRKRVTQFEFFPSAEEAEYSCIVRNRNWMKKKFKKAYRHAGFVTATHHNSSIEDAKKSL